MKKLLAISTSALVTFLVIAAWDYTGPWDERSTSFLVSLNYTLGWYAQNANAVALVEVFEEGTEHPETDFGFVKARVVNAFFGCTNGQELVILKHGHNPDGLPTDPSDWDFIFFPTNNSRVVCALIEQHPPRKLPLWTPKVWKQSAPPPTLVSSTNSPMFHGSIRCWWDEDYQNNLPLVHLTNLLHSAQVERNWTNFYYKVRDAVPTSASPRVWHDSFRDIAELLMRATPAQFNFIMNDPLFPVECEDRRLDIFTRSRRYGEDE